MKKIPLTQGKFVIVDDKNFEWLNQRKWQAEKRNTIWYATRVYRDNEGKCHHCYMHRTIFLTSSKNVGHKNLDGLDNREENLRPVTSVQRACYRRKTKNKTSSKYKGVVWHKHTQKWIAHIGFNLKSIYLGIFESEDAAARAYDKAAKQYFCEFAILNFPDES